MMVKSILLDQNAKEWEVEIQSPSGFFSAFIDEKTQKLKLYYIHDNDEESQTVKIVDCGTNQEPENINLKWANYLASVPQHEGNIVHHLFWEWQ